MNVYKCKKNIYKKEIYLTIWQYDVHITINRSLMKAVFLLIVDGEFIRKALINVVL